MEQATLSLDGDAIHDRAALHAEIARQLPLPPYYGNNLDALWDVLSARRAPLEILLRHSDSLLRHLGTYGEAFLALLRDLERENGAVTLRID